MEEVKCKYKRKRHPVKYFAIMLFLWLLLSIVNFTGIVLAFNYDEYQWTQGYVIEHGQDVLFGVLPRTKWGYTFEGKHYENNSLMINKYLFWDNYSEHIDIYVNKKVPEDSLLYFKTDHSWFNYLCLGLMLFCFFEIIYAEIINAKIRHFRKMERERIRAEREDYKAKLSNFKRKQKQLQTTKPFVIEDTHTTDTEWIALPDTERSDEQ